MLNLSIRMYLCVVRFAKFVPNKPLSTYPHISTRGRKNQQNLCRHKDGRRRSLISTTFMM